MKVLVNNEEVLCDKNIVIEEEMLNTSSVILNNVFPKLWEQDKDYVSRFYYPPDYSKCLIYNSDEEIPSEDYGDRLPSEYQEVEYIEADGDQYIDTGMTLSEKNEAELKISNITYGNTKIFGSRTSATSDNFAVISTATSLVCDFYNYNNNRLTVSTPIAEPITIKTGRNGLQINDNTKSITTFSSFTTPDNAYIFSGSGTFPAAYTNAKARLYYCKIRLYDTYIYGELVRDFVPCYRKSDNEIGLYDLVTNTFFTNAGTGSFTKGADVDPLKNVLFCGMVRNTGEISLNPRYPHYCNLQVLDFKDFLSQGETLDFVLTEVSVREAIEKIVSTISDYGFVVGNINIIGADDIIGAYSTLEKTAYDVFNYLADITQSKWTTRMVSRKKVAIDFYDPSLMPTGTPIQYTNQFFEDYGINDMSFNYSTNDYRNRQVMTSDEVYGNIQQSQTLVANGYQTQYTTEQKIGQIEKITVDGVEKTFIKNTEKDLGQVADFYYTVGEKAFESEATLNAGQIVIIYYTPIIKGRQVITNSNEIERVANSIGRKGVIARYENRSDATTSDELQKIGQAYIQYKGSPEITLTVESTQNTWNVGEVVNFNAPLPELTTNYLVKKKTINIISTVDTIFYTYEMTSSFNTENAINYFDNQRSKNSGNIGEGEFIDRNVSVENTANIIFYDTTIGIPISVTYDNTIECSLNAPFIN